MHVFSEHCRVSSWLLLLHSITHNRCYPKNQHWCNNCNDSWNCREKSFFRIFIFSNRILFFLNFLLSFLGRLPTFRMLRLNISLIWLISWVQICIFNTIYHNWRIETFIFWRKDLWFGIIMLLSSKELLVLNTDSNLNVVFLLLKGAHIIHDIVISHENITN